MDLPKCFILFLLYFLITIVNKYNLYNIEIKSEKFYKNKENYKKIQDIFHNIMPHLDIFEYASDILFVCVLIYLIIINYQLLYTFFGFGFTILVIRQLVMRMTILPKNEKCNIENTSCIRGGCYDKIFSAHFAAIFLMTLIMYDNGIINTISAILLNSLNGFFILISRNHYTIDIIVSIFVVILVYQNNLNICEFLDKHL